MRKEKKKNISQRMKMVSRSWKAKGNGFSPRASRRSWPFDTLIIGLLTSKAVR
jgi:hypothetical protein